MLGLERWLRGQLNDRERARELNLSELSKYAQQIDDSEKVINLLPRRSHRETESNAAVEWRLAVQSLGRYQRGFVNRTLMAVVRYNAGPDFNVGGLRMLASDSLQGWKNVGKKGAEFLKKVFPREGTKYQ